MFSIFMYTLGRSVLGHDRTRCVGLLTDQSLICGGQWFPHENVGLIHV